MTTTDKTQHSSRQTFLVTGEGGWRATAHPAAAEERGGTVTPRLLIRPEDGGAAVVVPAEMVRRQEDGTYYLPLTRSMALAYTAQDTPTTATTASLQHASPASNPNVERVVIPVVEETLFVGKQMVETGKGVRVTKSVRETTEIVDEPLLREEVTVERIAVNQVVQAFPEPRQEGETMIIPVVEEVLVIEKRLLVKEEVRITRENRVVRHPQEVTLRHEEARIEQIGSEQTKAVTTP